MIQNPLNLHLLNLTFDQILAFIEHLIFLKVNWVDLGTDVDWAQRTVEQMEKVIVVYFFGRNFPGRLRCNCLFGDVLDCLTHLCM